MQIVFLDESGQPGGFDEEKNELVKNTSKYFTLAGFMIDADDILKVEQNLKKIKIKHNLQPNHEIKWHTTYSKYGMDYKEYEVMRTEIVDVISHYKGSVIGIVMDKESCYRKKDYISNPNDLYAIALHLLMERYSMQTTQFGRSKNQKPVIMIADSRQSINNNKLDKQLKIAYLRAKNMGTHFVKFPNFAENIIFADSDDFSGIQLADYCAGIIHKKFEMEDDKFFELLKPSIRKHKNNIYGPGIKLYQ